LGPRKPQLQAEADFALARHAAYEHVLFKDKEAPRCLGHSGGS
jgi:hypothetical protein